MSQEIINVGSSPNDGAGDPIRAAFIKTNNNFEQLFALPNPTPPTTLFGKDGDIPGMYAYDADYFYYCFGTYDSVTVIWAQVAQINNISVSNIVNGTSSVRIGSANSNVAISVNGTSNVAVFSSTGVSLTGNINVPLGNVQAFAFYTYNNVSAAGNVRGGNIKTTGQITATGNVYGDILVGNYLYGDGSNISNISGGSGNYSNANVAAYLPVYSGNLSANFMSVTGNIQAFAYYTSNNISAAGNIRGGNIVTAGQVSATGNITTSGYFVGNFVGNVTGNLIVPGSNTQILYNNNGNAGASAALSFNSASNILSVAGNIIASTYLGTAVSASGNITANFFNGNGSALTGIVVSSVGTLSTLSVTGNTQSGNLLTGGIVSATGNITGNNLSIQNIQANGAIFSNANVISISNSGANGVAINGAGIIAGANVATILYDNSVFGWTVNQGWLPAANITYNLGRSNRYWNNFYTVNVNASDVAISNSISAVGNITGNYFLGNGSQLTGVTVSSISAAALTGSTLSSNVSNSTLTSVGTLGNLSVSGNVVASGVITSTGTFRLPSYTTVQRDALSAVEGDMIYNSTLKKIQAYQSDATNNVTWVSLSVSTYQ